jgi:hypothetical protein
VQFEVIQKATTPAHHHQKAAAGSMVFFVGLEMLGQLTDTLAQNGDLDLRATGVIGVGAVLTDDLLLFLGC